MDLPHRRPPVLCECREEHFKALRSFASINNAAEPVLVLGVICMGCLSQEGLEEPLLEPRSYAFVVLTYRSSPTPTPTPTPRGGNQCVPLSRQPQGERVGGWDPGEECSPGRVEDVLQRGSNLESEQRRGQ